MPPAEKLYQAAREFRVATMLDYLANGHAQSSENILKHLIEAKTLATIIANTKENTADIYAIMDTDQQTYTNLEHKHYDIFHTQLTQT